MSKFVLLAETGSDITAEMAERHGIYLVPMHVIMGNDTFDDASFPAEEIVNYYHRTGKLPKTSGCTPEDFAKVFEKIHREHPDKHILHLAYSAVTTCSYQNALIAAENLDYVTSIDTKNVSAGQAAIVLETQKLIDNHPNMTLQEVTESVQKLIADARMSFVPSTLDFLHAGGRLSNAAFVAGRLLSIHPRVELKDGYLMATKKYRGRMNNIAIKLLQEMTEIYNLDRKQLWLLMSPGLSKNTQDAAESAAKELGFKQIGWIRTGCVITAHGGPGAFGVVGFEQRCQ